MLYRVENLSPAMGRGIDSRNRVWNWVAKLHRLAGRYNKPIPTWFLVPIEGLKLPTPALHTVPEHTLHLLAPGFTCNSIILSRIGETKRNYVEIDPANPISILNLWQNNTYVLNCNYVEEFRQNTKVPKQHFVLFHQELFSSFPQPIKK
jgi:hypothetical protein